MASPMRWRWADGVNVGKCELDDGAVITVDWTIDPSFEQTQYLMCVRLDAQGHGVATMES